MRDVELRHVVDLRLQTQSRRELLARVEVEPVMHTFFRHLTRHLDGDGDQKLVERGATQLHKETMVKSSSEVIYVHTLCLFEYDLIRARVNIVVVLVDSDAHALFLELFEYAFMHAFCHYSEYHSEIGSEGAIGKIDLGHAFDKECEIQRNEIDAVYRVDKVANDFLSRFSFVFAGQLLLRSHFVREGLGH